MSFLKMLAVMGCILLFAGTALAESPVKVGLEARFANFSFEPYRLEVTGMPEQLRPFMIAYSPAIAPEITFGNRVKLRAGASLDIVISAGKNKEVLWESCDVCGNVDESRFYDVIVSPKFDLGFFGEGEIVVNKVVSFLGGYSKSENDFLFRDAYKEDGDLHEYAHIPLGTLKNEKKYGGLRLKGPNNGLSFLFTFGMANSSFEPKTYIFTTKTRNAPFFGLSGNYTLGW